MGIDVFLFFVSILLFSRKRMNGIKIKDILKENSINKQFNIQICLNDYLMNDHIIVFAYWNVWMGKVDKILN